jgi:hypothetical protein
VTDPHPTSGQPADALPTSWQRLLALSGIAFAVLVLLAFFLSSAVTPKYTAPNHDWTTWAKNTEMKGRIAAFLALLAGLVFMPFVATIRDALGSAEARVKGSVRLARVAFAGGLIGITGITMAIVMLSGANTEGARSDPVVTKAIATATVGPFLVAPMGFVTLLTAAGLVTLRTGVFARWTGVVALLGALSFSITFLTTIGGTADGSAFGYGFFPGFLALVTWSIATSISRYRAVGLAADTSAAPGRGRQQAVPAEQG